ncbi:hypothetical protein NDI53_09175 [Leptolyngbya sp. NM3-A1]
MGNNPIQLLIQRSLSAALLRFTFQYQKLEFGLPKLYYSTSTYRTLDLQISVLDFNSHLPSALRSGVALW